MFSILHTVQFFFLFEPSVHFSVMNMQHQNPTTMYDNSWKVVNDTKQTQTGFYPVNMNFLCVFSFDLVLFDFHCVPETNGPGALLWLLVDWLAQQCSACGRAALTLGQRLPYCGPTTFLPFRASSPSLPFPPYWSTEDCGLVYFSCSQLHDRN